LPAEPAAGAAEDTSGTDAGPYVDDAGVSFRLTDEDGRLAGVRLQQGVGIPGGLLGFRRRGGGWRLAIDRPAVDRMEYLLELSYRDGRREVVPDPGNPRQAAGVFGVKSVIEFPGYSSPSWLAACAGHGASRTMQVAAPPLDAAIDVAVWSPAGVARDRPLPLLLVHDGPEYAALAAFARYLSAGTHGGWLPALRAALLRPGSRDRWYSANPGYARALRLAVIPALTAELATTVRVGMGASLGALAMLHAHRRYHDAFDALFLQSGSFFCPRFDDHERWFPYYRRITRFVAQVHAATAAERPVPVVLTCGAAEENLGNNRLAAQALRAQAYDVTLHEVPDAHNFTAWRDALHPHLTGLLARVCQ
jgi:enterochelin esterase-like enzyme